MIQRTDPHEPSLGTLFKDLADETRTLVRQEIEFAKTEMTQKASLVGRNVAYLAVGGAIAYAGLLVLLLAITAGLFQLLTLAVGPGVSSWLSPLIVGIVVGVVGYLLVQKGINTLRRADLAPHQTIDSIRENKEWLKNRLTSEKHV